jgi:predicted DNA-binding transcriptional regulator AlpA
MDKPYAILPRLIRLRDAPAYLGMDRNRFNADVRPYVTEVPLGKQAIAFDRLELDAWVDDYIQCNGRPGRSRGETTWDANPRQGSSNEAGSGTSTSESADGAFARALEALNKQKRSDISQG